MNTLLQCQQKIPLQLSEIEENEKDEHLQLKNSLPIINYNKLHKLLRNLIIYTSQTVESIQIEVYV